MITKGPEETRALGRKLCKYLRPGDTLLMLGDLGAGKSEMTRGIAEGLGVAEKVTSPSFTILNVYESGSIPLYHFDWYRIEDAEELYELSMDEYLQMNGVAVVEWAERAPEVVPESYLEITLTPTDDYERLITLKPAGDFRLLDETLLCNDMGGIE